VIVSVRPVITPGEWIVRGRKHQRANDANLRRHVTSRQRYTEFARSQHCVELRLENNRRNSRLAR